MPPIPTINFRTLSLPVKMPHTFYISHYHFLPKTANLKQPPLSVCMNLPVADISATGFVQHVPLHGGFLCWALFSRFTVRAGSPSFLLINNHSWSYWRASSFSIHVSIGTCFSCWWLLWIFTRTSVCAFLPICMITKNRTTQSACDSVKQAAEWFAVWLCLCNIRTNEVRGLSFHVPSHTGGGVL